MRPTITTAGESSGTGLDRALDFARAVVAVAPPGRCRLPVECGRPSWSRSSDSAACGSRSTRRRRRRDAALDHQHERRIMVQLGTASATTWLGADGIAKQDACTELAVAPATLALGRHLLTLDGPVHARFRECPRSGHRVRRSTRRTSLQDAVAPQCRWHARRGLVFPRRGPSRSPPTASHGRRNREPDHRTRIPTPRTRLSHRPTRASRRPPP